MKADKHPFSRSREKILAMLDDKYGTDLSLRLKKLDEEYNELREAANRNVPNTLTLEHCTAPALLGGGFIENYEKSI